MKRDTELRERALAGVSALIVFIALVLVAAIAAGVILDTAGFLQERAQTTGESSSDQISTTLDVLSVVGEVEEIDTSSTNVVDEPGGTTIYRITEVRVAVLASPGAPEINLNQSTVQVVQQAGSDSLVSGNLSTDATGDRILLNDSKPTTEDATPHFGLEQIQGEAFPLIQNPEDRYRFIIPFDGNVGSNNDAESTDALHALGEGQTVQLRFVTGPGGDTLEQFRTPSTIPEEDGATVIL